MPSPFPGVDPFVESQMWEDFHTNYITRIRDILTPELVPKYGVIVERRVYLERSAVSESQSFLPDVGVFDTEKSVSANASSLTATMPEPTICLLPAVEEHRESRLVIRNLQSREDATVIELLSPTNKLLSADGREIYLEKRSNLLRTNLAYGDPDVYLDLQAAFTSAYDHARYDVILDYQQPVTPRLSPEDQAWVDGLLGRSDG